MGSKRHVCRNESFAQRFFEAGYLAAQADQPMRDSFRIPEHNEFFRWGYFSFMSEREEIQP